MSKNIASHLFSVAQLFTAGMVSRRDMSPIHRPRYSSRRLPSRKRLGQEKKGAAVIEQRRSH